MSNPSPKTRQQTTDSERTLRSRVRHDDDPELLAELETLRIRRYLRKAMNRGVPFTEAMVEKMRADIRLPDGTAARS